MQLSGWPDTAGPQQLAGRRLFAMDPGQNYPTTWGGSPATPGMTTEEQYIFDLAGFVVCPRPSIKIPTNPH